MAGKLVVVLFAFLAVQGWTAAGVIPEGKILDLIVSANIPELDLLHIPDEVFELLPENEPAVTGDPQNCVDHIQEAYDTAVEARRIINKGKELAKRLREAVKKCRSLSAPEDKKECYISLKAKVVAEGKPLREAYKQFRPKVTQVMGKFDKCMA